MKKCRIIIAAVFSSAVTLVLAIRIGLYILAGFLFPVSPTPVTPAASLGEYYCAADCTYYTFQDHTSYEEYHYSQISLAGNPYFQPVTPNDMEKIHSLVDSYEWLVKGFKDYTDKSAQALYQSYRYDRSSLSTDDYYYLNENDREEYGDIDLYILDCDTLMLYHLEVTV